MKINKVEPAVPEVDMTPMIDIVFQLIAFFMVITNFEQTQADERVKLPEDQLARPAKSFEGPEHNRRIMTAKAKIVANGHPHGM